MSYNKSPFYNSFFKLQNNCHLNLFQVYVDGYLTNRYYNSRYESAVVTNVDVNVPHKIAVVAQASLEDDCIAMLCEEVSTMSKKKQNKMMQNIKERDNQLSAHVSLWRPSIYLYDPTNMRAETFSETSIL